MIHEPIKDLRSLERAKSLVKERANKRGIVLQTHIDLMRSRWKNERVDGQLKNKGKIMDGCSLLLDAIYAFRKGGKSNKQGIIMRSVDVITNFLIDRYGFKMIELLRNTFSGNKDEEQFYEE